MKYSIRKPIKSHDRKRVFDRGDVLTIPESPNRDLRAWVKHNARYNILILVCDECEKVKQDCKCYKKNLKIKEKKRDSDTMDEYQAETGKNAIWQGKVTKGYKTWKKDR